MVERRGVARLLIGLLLLLAALYFHSSAVAQVDVNQAGLVVLFDEGDVLTECVTFEEEITGYELLERAGLSVVIKDYGGGLGFAVCKIEDLGCDYPAKNCFCRGDDISWRYWYWEDGGWVYSGLGASSRTVEDGDVDAWVWSGGEGEPPDLDVSVLCSSSMETSTEILTETDAPSSIPASENEGQRRDFGVFALLVAVLMMIIGYVTLLRKRT